VKFADWKQIRRVITDHHAPSEDRAWLKKLVGDLRCVKPEGNGRARA